MTQVPISPDIVGIEIDPVASEWVQKDCQLYAVGVGAKPEGELEFIFEGKGPKVIPSFGVVPGFAGMIGIMSKVEVNPAMILHGEQAVTQHRPIPPNAKVETTGSIVECWDKGKAAVIVVECTSADSDGPIVTNRSSIFVRGAGDFGGESGPSTKGKNTPPDREPDHVWSDVTRAEQAAIYRLSGDYNPLHIDPDFAKMAGFERPFLHGLCTYGFTCRGIVATVCGGDPDKFGMLEARFADQVWPEDTVVVKLWDTGPGEAIVQAENQNGGVVLSQARTTFTD